MPTGDDRQTTVARPDKWRLHNWYDSQRDVLMWGIQCRVAPREWAHVHSGGRPMLYDTRAEAESAMADLEGRHVHE